MNKPLLNLREVLGPAEAEGYAVGAFTMCNAETADAIMATAAEAHSPLIIMLGPKEVPLLGLDNSVQIVRTLARNYPIPICLHLDHSWDPAEVRAALEAGFPSVMIDFSNRPDEENIEVTRTIVELARETEATVEAEIGYVGYPDANTEQEQPENHSAESRLTDPAVAKHFARATGVDALAISIGTAHGRSAGLPVLDFARLDEINRRVQVPLVLHGASGRSADQIGRAVALGIRKVNVATELARVFADTMAQALTQGKGFFWHADALGQVKEAYRPVIRRWLEALGSIDRAG